MVWVICTVPKVLICKSAQQRLTWCSQDTCSSVILWQLILAKKSLQYSKWCDPGVFCLVGCFGWLFGVITFCYSEVPCQECIVIALLKSVCWGSLWCLRIKHLRNTSLYSFYMYMCLSAYMSLNNICVSYDWIQGKGFEFPGTIVIDDFVLAGNWTSVHCKTRRSLIYWCISVT